MNLKERKELPLLYSVLFLEAVAKIKDSAYAIVGKEFAFPIIARQEKKPYEALWTSIGCCYCCWQVHDETFLRRRRGRDFFLANFN